MKAAFADHFAELFRVHYPRLFRYLDRLSGEPDLAADLAQDAFVRLYQRGAAPDRVEAWLITVATNLFRNARTQRSRRTHLLTEDRARNVLADPPASPAAVSEDDGQRQRVRAVINQLSERDRQLLLLRAEGYAYRDIARALDLEEASVGTLLARAKRAFRDRYEGAPGASR